MSLMAIPYLPWPKSCSRCRTRSGGPHQRLVQTGAFRDIFKAIFSFEEWAPRSSKAWRLRQYDYSKQNLPKQEVDAAGEVTETASGLQQEQGASRSFTDVTDQELSEALHRRMGAMSTETQDLDEQDLVAPLSGNELRRLLKSKYGKTYDLSFVRRDVPGKTFVSLNIMWTHLEQRTFPMTESEYMEKVEAVASLVNVLGQTGRVRSFLLAPAKAQKGLPARPVVGTAISLRLDLTQRDIDEWFAQGYQ